MRTLAAPVAFNEGEKIGRVLDRFTPGLVDKIIVVDDASTDETRREVERRGVEVVSHEKRYGVGAAIRTAVKYARSHGFDVIVILAGNDKDRPSEIPLLLREIADGCDLAQGSRYLAGGTSGGMPAYRRLATRLHPWLMNLATGSRFTDTTNGFRAIRLSIFSDPRINLDQEWLNAYELEPYILYRAATLGYRVKEVPVTKIYPPKKLGYTKIRPGIDWWKLLRPIFLLKLGLRK